jgi:hypothetical protein
VYLLGVAHRSEKHQVVEDEEIVRTLEVELRHARLRHLGWALAGLVLGAMAVVKLGPIGKMVGVGIILGGLWAARGFVLTLLHAAGVIAIREDEVVLTPWVCAGRSVVVPVGEVHHAYFLRRAVPWTTTGPILVIETSAGAFTFPRDWFHSESDQTDVARVLNRRLGRI